MQFLPKFVGLLTAWIAWTFRLPMISAASHHRAYRSATSPPPNKAHVAGSDHRHEFGSINNLGILDTTSALADVCIPAFPPNGQTRGEQTECFSHR